MGGSGSWVYGGSRFETIAQHLRSMIVTESWLDMQWGCKLGGLGFVGVFML